MAKKIFPNSFTVQVTQEDINRGQKGKSNTCAVARAVRRVLKVKNVRMCYDGKLNVGKTTKYPYESLVSYIATAFKKIETFIERFDEGKIVKPTSFTFKLEKQDKNLW